MDQEACEFLEAFDAVVKAARIEGGGIMTLSALYNLAAIYADTLSLEVSVRFLNTLRAQGYADRLLYHPEIKQ